MKRALPIFAGLLLLGGVTACTDAEQPETVDATPTTVQPATFKVGDTINVGVNGDVINLTVTAAQLGGECKYSTLDYATPTTDEDGQLVQLWAEVAPELLNLNSWTVLDDPKVITKDGFTEDTTPAWDCAPSDDGYGSWSDTVDLGEKIRVYGAFRVADGFESLKFEDHRLPREEIEQAGGDAPQPPAAKEDSAESAAPHVVECLEGTPGPALWSDGETRYSEECFQKLGGPAYMEQESQSGLAPGGAAINGYGTDANGNPNRTSGDMQAEWGCQQGYITDPAICSNY